MYNNSIFLKYVSWVNRNKPEPHYLRYTVLPLNSYLAIITLDASKCRTCHKLQSATAKNNQEIDLDNLTDTHIIMCIIFGYVYMSAARILLYIINVGHNYRTETLLSDLILIHKILS